MSESNKVSVKLDGDYIELIFKSGTATNIPVDRLEQLIIKEYDPSIDKLKELTGQKG